jgi:hypothetical protein
MVDPLDEIVYLFSSLPVLAAKKACKEKFKDSDLFAKDKL